MPAETAATIERDGQICLWWDETPIDLFFDYAPVHADAARNRRTLPFAGTRIPVLGPAELAVFKVRYDRTRDWADIEAMIAAGTLDLNAVREALAGWPGRPMRSSAGSTKRCGRPGGTPANPQAAVWPVRWQRGLHPFTRTR